MHLFYLIGETLRRIRNERGKTLAQIGKEAGVGRGQLSRIENSHQKATFVTLSKILVSQGISRREFFRRYELVEAEALGLQNDEVSAAGGAAAEEWPAEVRQALKQVESFVSAAFLQPRPVAQGTLELGDLVILFRVVSKNPPPSPDVPAAPPAVDTPPPAPEPPKKRPGRPRKAS